MKTYIENGARVTIMDSADELIARTNESPCEQLVHDDRWVSRSGEFVGREFSTMNEARDAARVLWQAGMTVLDRMRADLAKVKLPAPKSRKRRLKWDEANGDEVDNDRLRSGQDYWRTSHRELTTGPATRVIIVHLGANGGVDSMDFLWRGAAAIALAEALESAGYRVELWATITVEGRFTDATRNEYTAIQLKAAGDVVDPSTLVNVCSGWFYRTMCWRNAEVTGPIDGGMGSNKSPSKWHLDTISTDADRIVIAGVFSYDAALDAVRRELAPLAVC